MNKKIELKHHKDFHKLELQNFKVKERSLIMALSYKLMEQPNDELIFDVGEIAKISNYVPTEKGDNIYLYLEKLFDKLSTVKMKVYKTDNDIKKIVLFIGFETFKNIGKIKIGVNQDYRYLLNNVSEPFTIQNLVEYSELKSGYSQLAYSLLKEWEGTCNRKWEVDIFRKLLGVPKDYTVTNFNERVLKPILKELPKYFPNLKLEKIKTGKKVTSLKFSWKKKRESKKTLEQIEGIKIKKGLGEKEFQEIESVNIEIKEQIDTDIIEITRAEYEGLYLEYVMKNSGTNSIFMRKTFDIANSNKYKIIG